LQGESVFHPSSAKADYGGQVAKSVAATLREGKRDYRVWEFWIVLWIPAPIFMRVTFLRGNDDPPLTGVGVKQQNSLRCRLGSVILFDGGF